MIDQVLQYLEDDHDMAVKRLEQLLTIPSVSTDPAYCKDVERAAQWVCDNFNELGLVGEVHHTDGHPIVVARSQSSADDSRPRVLFYGHYDVQPPDPIDQWETPPFEPTIRDGAIHARGASDDKGQVSCFIEALRAWKKVHGSLPVNITAIIEGEEEIGSVHLTPFLKENKELLQADVAVISDTTMWDRETIAITYALRGMVYFDIQLHGPNRDLHSGVYGGTIPNPANIMTQILGRLFDENNKITIPGFYDDVIAITEEEHEQWEVLDFDEHSFLDRIGIKQGFGEGGYNLLERRWARPACDFNGLYGGYGGQGAKTIIPESAGAKVSFRITANQTPQKVANSFEQWLRDQPVHGLEWKIQKLGDAEPVIVSTKSPYMSAAKTACEKATGNRSVMVRDGATIPVVSDFKHILGVDSLMIGFGLNDDRIHSPNEKFDLGCFKLGCKTLATLFAELAKIKS